jgi:hypothetical protein
MVTDRRISRFCCREVRKDAYKLKRDLFKRRNQGTPLDTSTITSTCSLCHSSNSLLPSPKPRNQTNQTNQTKPQAVVINGFCSHTNHVECWTNFLNQSPSNDLCHTCGYDFIEKGTINFFPHYLGSERYERILKINYADHCVDREASVIVGEKGKINMDWLDEVSVFFSEEDRNWGLRLGRAGLGGKGKRGTGREGMGR